jgi:Protein of unknown function (DUF1573)
MIRPVLIFLLSYATFFPFCGLLKGADGVKWDQRSRQILFVSGKEKPMARFGFINQSGHAVEIQSARPSCPCSTASFTKGAIAPLGRGEVIIQLVAEDRHSPFDLQNNVRFSDGETAMLSLNVNFAGQPEFSTHELIWQPNESLTPKSLKIGFQRAPGTEPGSAIAPSENFKISSHYRSADRIWIITVAPKERTAGTAFLKLVVKNGDQSVTFPILLSTISH